jgi:hypothetical protein
MPSGVHTYSPSTVVGTNSGAAVWSGVSNAIACDGLYASVAVYNESPILTASGFGITDSASTITNAGISVTAYSDSAFADGNIYVFLIIGGVTYTPGNVFATLTQTPAVYNLANTTWSPSLNWSTANLSTLQVMVNPGNNLSDDATIGVFIDCVRLNIYYTTLGGGGGSPQLDFCFKLGF